MLKNESWDRIYTQRFCSTNKDFDILHNRLSSVSYCTLKAHRLMCSSTNSEIRDSLKPIQWGLKVVSATFFEGTRSCTSVYCSLISQILHKSAIFSLMLYKIILNYIYFIYVHDSKRFLHAFNQKFMALSIIF